MAMRWRGVTVLTNTPPRTSQRAPGGMQGNGLMEPVLTKAANKLGIDQVQMRLINAPAGKAPFGPPAARGKQAYVTSAFVKEALAKGAELFNWEEKKARSGKRQGTKVRGSGVAVSAFAGGSIGFDGLFIIKPDGRVQFQSGIGNLGTHSVIDVHRVAAEMLGVPWEKCDVVFGNTAKHLPWSCVSAGSQTTHAMTRAAHAAATDAKKKLQEIAAKTLGGSPDTYQVGDERVYSGSRSMTFAQAAKKAIELGGKYDGHEAPEDINAFTKRSLDRAGRTGPDRRGERQLSARRPDAVLHGRLRRSRSRRRDRSLSDSRVRGDRGRRNRDQSAQPAGSDLRRRHAGNRTRHQPEVGLRPALRRAARQALPLQSAAHDSRQAD